MMEFAFKMMDSAFKMMNVSFKMKDGTIYFSVIDTGGSGHFIYWSKDYVS